MQLSKIAALAIIATGVTQAENYVSVEYLQYDENDNRVSVMAPSLTASYDIGTDYNIKADFVHDSVSGATPSYLPDGASGASSRVTNSTDFIYGKQAFNEERNAGSLVITKRFANRDELIVGGDYSRESDFDAKTVSLEYMHYLNASHNTSLNLGASYGFNEILSFTNSSTTTRNRRDDDRFEREDDYDTSSGASRKETSTSLNVQAGITQILSPTSSMKVAGFAIMDEGYLTNPHAFVVRDYSTAPKLVGENRPDTRRAYGVDLKYITLLGERMSYQVGYRYYTDDWKINSHTIENDLYYKLGKRVTLGAGLRYYTQTEASFYNGAKDYFTNEEFASSDERLSSFDALTYKANLDFKQNDKISYNIGGEFYSQSTGLDATLITVGAKFRF